mmetsp:Transcript_32584/g.66519  ORF Transcript_32584/g.66519 Transcript_32584/m.66519 type:complete len:102 (+) Transcript_32584:1719-2024(+)
MQQQMQQEMQQQQQQASAQQSLAEDDAALELDRVAGRMDQFRAEAVDGELGQDANKRMEAFGFLIADLLQLDFETATEVCARARGKKKREQRESVPFKQAH